MIKNIILVGPMGSGKTTIGRQLAKRLRFKFVDSDRAIEERTGADIPLIFDLEGEAGFRKRERDMIASLTEGVEIVLATGGGSILDPENRKQLISFGHVIYLSCTVDQQVQRTSRNRNRPLLQTEDPRSVLEELFSVRDPLYKQTADTIISTDGKNVKQVVAEIFDAIEPHGGGQ